MIVPQHHPLTPISTLQRLYGESELWRCEAQEWHGRLRCLRRIYEQKGGSGDADGFCKPEYIEDLIKFAFLHRAKWGAMANSYAVTILRDHGY